ncbi:MAG TPA: DUF2516 family protein [Mycobacteriales bacterium]|jgi:hypothetical protein
MLALDIITPVVTVVGLVLTLAALATELYALIHSIAQRADAFPAAGKLTKPAWIGINLAALGATLLFGIGPNRLLGLVAITAALVYIVDVRPAVREVSEGGNSPW